MKQLQAAVEACDIEKVKEILEKKTRIALKTFEGGYLLWRSVCLNQMDIAAMLVKGGAEVNLKNAEGDTLMHFLVSKEDVIFHKLAALILDYGGDVGDVDKQQRNVLLRVIRSRREGMLGLVENLLRRGTLVSGAEMTHAIDHPDMNKLVPSLLNVGFNDQRRAGAACFILETLCGNYRPESEKIPMVRQLLEIDISKSCLGSCLISASRRSNLEIARLLLQQGADPQHSAPDGRTALHFAAEVASTDMLQLLLLSGADVTIMDKQGRTPLAATSPNSYIEKKLIVAFLVVMDEYKKRKASDDWTYINKEPQLKKYRVDCLKELKQMKKIFVTNKDSLFSLLLSNGKRLTYLMSRKKFRFDKISKISCFNEFQIYGLTLKEVYSKANRRKLILSKNIAAIHDCLDETLCELVVDNIIEHFIMNDENLV